MAKISAVINTLNEESNIAFCLETLKWCDEIIVVDMQSEDRTVEIAANFTDKIYNFERVGYVEPARKFAVEQATGDWILLIDADELVPKQLADKLGVPTTVITDMESNNRQPTLETVLKICKVLEVSPDIFVSHLNLPIVVSQGLQNVLSGQIPVKNLKNERLLEVKKEFLRFLLNCCCFA